MKNVLLATTIALLTSCASNTTSTKAKVVRDCTGTYLRIDDKDYLVCNNDVLKNYKENSELSATFEKISECKELEGTMVCMMYHENEGMIRITSLK